MKFQITNSKRTIIKIINKIKEGMYQHLNEFKEDTNRAEGMA
jgi:hypothetical protein